jgi:hypothetical protein
LVGFYYTSQSAQTYKKEKIIIIFMKTGNIIATSLIWIGFILHLILQFDNIDGLVGFQIGILIAQVIYNCCD